MIRVSATQLDAYSAFLSDDEFPLSEFLKDLRGEKDRTPAMERGRAFAKAMEHAAESEGNLLSADGHAFAFTCEAEIEAWPRREMRAEKDYGGIVVSARCDRLHGNVIADDKTTASFSKGGVEKYIDKWQWRFYLDIFGAQEFIWHVWSVKELEVPEVKCGCDMFLPHLTDFCPVHGIDGYRSQYAGLKHGYEVFAHDVIKNYRYPELENECREFALDFKSFAERTGIDAVLSGHVRVA